MIESASRTNRSGRWLLIFPAIIVVALVVNGLDPSSRNARLYFLDASGTRLVAERRELALMGSLENRSQQVLGELMLGPFDHTLQLLFRQDARLRAVLHRGGKLHVELEIPEVASIGVPFELIRSAFEKSLSASVPGTGSLELYVNGNLSPR